LKIAILGAGVTGLALARLLDEDGFEVHVLEKSPVAGGLCRSSVIDGFICDHAGGHILFSKDARVLSWMKEQVGADQLVERDRNTKIRWHDRWVPYPFENGIGHLTPEARFDCLKGYLQSVQRRDSGEPCPEDFASWIQWKMGPGFAKHFMVPYNEKIWSCDLADMSSAWVAGRVPDAPVDDILKAAVGIDTKGYKHQAHFWFPLRGGFQALTDGILSHVRGHVRLSTPVQNVQKKGESFRVNDEDFDLVVNTIPLPELAKVLEGIPSDVAEDIDQLQPISLINVLLGFKTDAPLDDLSWIYLPFEDQGPANRVTYFSNYSPRNAPKGHGSFMAEVTYRGRLDVDQAWIDDLARGLERAGLLRRSDLVATHHFRSRYAYIDQDRAFPDRIRRVRDWFDGSGIYTVGRFGRYEYHNSDQCISRAMEVREQLLTLRQTGSFQALQLD